jgi:hypothetical protein
MAATKPLPDRVRVSVGFPHKARKHTIGQCWHSAADGVHQIFISPILDDVSGSQGVLATLLHECCHAALPSKAQHRQPFKRLATAVGLAGPATATIAGPDLLGEITRYAEQLGLYPHAALVPKDREGKQSTRLIKCECETCGYVARVAQKWIDVGAPHCPHHGAMSV